MARRPAPDAPSEEGYGYPELLPLVRATLEAGLSALVRGHPGVGKSTLAAELAASMGLPLVDLRLAQREPAEIGGVYFPDRDRGELALLAPPWVRRVCDAPALLFLDEINAAVTRLHQAAAYQIVLERRVGPFRFHPGTVVMAAGNLEDDQAIVTPLSAALMNRFVHFQLRVDVDAWLAWGERAGLAPPVLAFVRAHRFLGPAVLYDAEDGGDAFPSPRSWEMASRLLMTAEPRHARRVVAACVGPRMADRFYAFLRLYERVSPAAIVARGKAMDFTGPKTGEPSFVHAAVAAVAAWIAEQGELDEAWLPNVVRFMRSPGLDPEHVFVFLRALKARSGVTRQLRADPGYREVAADLVALHAGLFQ